MEVDERRDALGPVHHHVLGLDVSMDDPLRVERVEALGDLREPLEELHWGRGRALFREPATVETLGDDVRASLFVEPHAEHAQDVRMADAHRRFAERVLPRGRVVHA